MKRSLWLEGLGVFAVSFLYLRVLPNCFSLFDEGIFASIAERVVHGQQLYRDVSTHYLPGTFWLLALLFGIAGETIDVLRLSLALFAATAAVAIWRLARDHGGRSLAILAALSPAVACYPIWWMASPHWYSSFAALAVALLVRQALAGGNPNRWLIGAGVGCAATILLLQPVGAGVTVAVAVTVFADAWSTVSFRAGMQRTILLAAGTCLPLVAVVGCFGLQGSLTTLLADAVLWNLRHYSAAFQIAYGTIPFGLSGGWTLHLTSRFLAGVPPLLLAVAVAVLVRRYSAGMVDARDRSLLALWSVTVGLWIGNLYYPDTVHLAAAAPPAFALMAALWARMPARLQQRQVIVALIWLAALSALGAAALQRNREACPHRVETMRGPTAASAEAAADLRLFLPYVATHVPADASLFVYPYAPGYYFLTGRRNPTRHEYLFPYLTGAHSDAQLQEVAAELGQSRPSFIVLSLLWGRAMLSHYDTPVERYIRTNYHVAREFPLTVLLERDAPGKAGPKIDFAP